MRCKCCNAEIRYITTRQIKIPHPTKKGLLKIVHEEEDLCRNCITISQSYYNDCVGDEDFDITSLGVELPQQYSDEY